MKKMDKFHKISKAQLNRVPLIVWIGAYALMTLFFILFGGLAAMSDLAGLEVLETVKILALTWLIFHIGFVLVIYLGCLVLYFLLGAERYGGSKNC